MRTYKHFSWGHKRSLLFVGVQEVSDGRVRKELINRNLYLLAWPLRVDYGWPFVNDEKFKKYIYSHSTKYICTQGIILHPATVYLYSFKELYFTKYIYSLTKSIIIRGNYIRSRSYIHFKAISSFKENIFIQGSYIHSRKYIHLRNIYSFKLKAICLFKETIFIQQRCVRGHSRNTYSKIVPSHF